MYVKMPAKDLALILNGLARIIPNHPTLPILRGVYLHAKEGHLTATGTDLDCFVTGHCRHVDIRQEGIAIVADARRLKTIVQHARQEEVTLRTINPDTIEVALDGVGGERIHVLVQQQATDWPEVPQGIKVESVDPLFLEHYRLLLPFSSTDSTRHTLEGVCCEVSKEGHLMVATDGRRLTSANSITLPIQKTVIVPRNKFLAWPKLQGDTCIGLHPKHSYMRITCGEWDATVRLIEGTYPNWRQVVPASSEEDTRFVLNESDVDLLLEAIRTLPGSDDQTKPVTIIAGTPHPRLAACCRDTGTWSYQVLPNSTWDGNTPAITLNRAYLVDAVKAGFRSFEIRNDLSPLVGRSNGKTHVLMPVRGEVPPEVEETKARNQVEQSPQSDADQPDTKPDEEPEETEPPRKEINIMIQPKQNNRTEDQTPDLWTQYQTVKDKARELNSAIAELGQSIKGYHKDQKTVRVELDNARGVLAKLQSINI
jgi:DNA polymerase III subunit beta